MPYYSLSQETLMRSPETQFNLKPLYEAISLFTGIPFHEAAVLSLAEAIFTRLLTSI